jgi:hypothetical protein
VKVELKHVKAGVSPSWTVGNERVSTADEACELVRRELSKNEKGHVVVRHESPHCVDVLIVDTPGIGVSTATDALVKAECW